MGCWMHSVRCVCLFTRVFCVLVVEWGRRLAGWLVEECLHQSMHHPSSIPFITLCCQGDSVHFESCTAFVGDLVACPLFIFFLFWPLCKRTIREINSKRLAPAFKMTSSRWAQRERDSKAGKECAT